MTLSAVGIASNSAAKISAIQCSAGVAAFHNMYSHEQTSIMANAALSNVCEPEESKSHFI